MARPINIQSPETPRTEISWAAVIAGALVALSLSFLVHTLNIGIGLSTFTTDSTGATALAIGGSLWLIICAIVTMFCAGWVAGKIASYYEFRPWSGLLHGFLAWSLALVIAIGLLSNLAGGFIAGQAANPVVAKSVMTAPETMSKRQVAESEKAAVTMGATALATFLVFLFGGISASLGGYYGSKNSRF